MVEIVKESNSSFRFLLKNQGGQILFTSVLFTSKNEIQERLSGFSKSTQLRGLERKTNHQGQFVVFLKDESGKLIGKSGVYNSEAGMENGIKNLKSLLAKL